MAFVLQCFLTDIYLILSILQILPIVFQGWMLQGVFVILYEKETGKEVVILKIILMESGLRS